MSRLRAISRGLVPQPPDLPDLVHADHVGRDALDDARDPAVGDPAVHAFAMTDVVGQESHVMLPGSALEARRLKMPVHDTRRTVERRRATPSRAPRVRAGSAGSPPSRDGRGTSRSSPAPSKVPSSTAAAISHSVSTSSAGSPSLRHAFSSGHADMLSTSRPSSSSSIAGLEQRTFARGAVDEDAADLGQVAGLGGRGVLAPDLETSAVVARFMISTARSRPSSSASSS